MITKKCAGPCGRELSEDEFPVHKGELRRATCRECFNEARRQRHATGLHERIELGGPSLIAFGSAIERQCAEALLRHTSIEDAARELRLTPGQVRAHLSELERRAAKRGYAPGGDMENPTPEGYHVKGVSSYYKVNEDGTRVLSGQWVKTKADEEHKLAVFIDAMSHVADAWQGKADPAPSQFEFDDDLLCVYPLGDPHLGMYAYAAETGNDFDLHIAEQNLVSAMDHLVSLAPASKEALVINLGDFFHADNPTNQTTRSHNALDVDTRWSKVLGVGVRAMRRLIDQALRKHDHVTVICSIGNHDDTSSIFLSVALQQFYEREPRVTIDPSPSKFHWYRFGKNLIGVTHGDTVKGKDLPGIMACDRARDWGETEHRFWLCGHIHHDTLKEYPGVTVETFRTLAGRDAWHHGQGYRSQRDAKLLVLHREHGQIMRHIVGINQITWSSDRCAA